MFTVPSSDVFADEVVDDRSIIADIANKTFTIELSDGASIFNYDADLRRTYNERILKGEEEMTLSLFDRFGGNLRFVPYHGEKKFKIGVADKIYSNMMENNGEFSIKVSDILEMNRAEINNVVYIGRPDIVSDEDIMSGYVDPRVSAYQGLSISGGDASLGNMYLIFSNILLEFITYLSSGAIFNDVDRAWTYAIDSGVFTQFSNIIKSILPIVVIVFIVTLLRGIIAMLKGSESIGDILVKSGSFILSIGIIYSALANPSNIKDIMAFAITETDRLFANAMSSSSNEVSRSDDDKYVVHATLWSKIVLDPWSKGMFDGRKYDELYTQYSDRGTKMPQSNDNIMTDWDTGEIKYASATLTGDISVPIGGGNEVKNWAALAWSTQSLYHIDAVEPESLTDDEDSDALIWPVAETTPRNDKIFVDNFRWLDAKLNISPGYISQDRNDGNYSKSRAYKTAFVKHGLESVFLVILLFPVLPATIRKLVVLVKIATSSARWVYFSIMSIIKPYDNRYSIMQNLKSVFSPLYDYYWWSMTIYIMLFLYAKLVGPFLGNVLWLIFAYIIIKFRPISPNRAVRQLTNKMKSTFNNIRKR